MYRRRARQHADSPESDNKEREADGSVQYNSAQQQEAPDNTAQARKEKSKQKEKRKRAVSFLAQALSLCFLVWFFHR